MTEGSGSGGSLSWLLCCCAPRQKQIETTFDERYGSTDISAPYQGAFSSPTYEQSSPMVQTRHVPSRLKSSSEKFSPTFSNAITTMGSPQQPNSPFGRSSTKSNNSIPVHEAFVPSDRHSLQTIAVRSPGNSPPASPPLPTPKSIMSYKSIGLRRGSSAQTSPLPPHMEKEVDDLGDARGAMPNTMATGQSGFKRGPEINLVPVHSKHSEHDWSPASEHSVEQWPGAY